MAVIGNPDRQPERPQLGDSGRSSARLRRHQRRRSLLRRAPAWASSKPKLLPAPTMRVHGCWRGLLRARSGRAARDAREETGMGGGGPPQGRIGAERRAGEQAGSVGADGERGAAATSPTAPAQDRRNSVSPRTRARSRPAFCYPWEAASCARSRRAPATRNCGFLRDPAEASAVLRAMSARELT